MAGQRCLNRVNFYKRSLLIRVPCPTIQPIPTPTTPNKFILIKITLSERMTAVVMRLNRIINFIFCFIFRIVPPIAFIEINIPEIDKNFNRINPSLEYFFPNANKI